jgi:hypothetical protein
VRKLVWEARGLQSNYAWLDAAASPPLDLGTTYFVEHLARGLVSTDVEVTVVAATGRGYATSSNPYRPVISRWGASGGQVGPNVIVVFVPRREQHTGLLHPLIMHELGHAIQDQHQLLDDIIDRANHLQRWLARLRKAVDEYVQNDPSTSVPEALGVIAHRLYSWLEEILCDSIATHVLGPTYLYSFLAEVAAGSMDVAAERHPPPRQRIRLMLAQLDKLGWDATMAGAAPQLDAWVRDTVGTEPAYQGLEGFLVSSMKTLAPHVRNRASRHVGRKRTFSPDDAALDAVKRLLEHEIPPAQFENCEAIPRQTIILGSWLFALGKCGDGIDAVVAAPDSEVLATLLPKSLEMSAVVEAWRRA